MALSLSEFRKCIGSDGAGDVCELEAGIHDITSSLVVARSGIEIRGLVSESRNLTILRRAEHAPGQLFTGELLRIADVSNIVVRALDIDGARFGSNAGGRLDHRHPNDPDPSSPLFASATRSGPTFVSPFEADMLVWRAGEITISDVAFNQPVRHAIAIGNNVHDLAIQRVTIRGAGDYGVWAGFVSADQVTWPLPDDVAVMRPRNLRVAECHIEDCGSAGIYLAAAQVVIQSCTFRRNHRDFPYNADGGQIEIDYKSHDIAIESSAILDGPSLERVVAANERQLFLCVGIEAYGSSLVFKNNRIEGNSHEGIRLNGARNVTICGKSTLIASNHTGRPQASARRDPVQNISITTTAEFAALSGFARDIQIEDIVCEHGILVWTNGSVEALRIDGMRIRGCSFPGAVDKGLVVGKNEDGSSIRGEGWSTDLNFARSEELHLERYDSDKVMHGHLERYDLALAPWRDKSIVLLEIGVHTGGSLVLWRDYFPSGTIVGVDMDLSLSIPPTERIHTYQGNQADTAFLSRVAQERAPDGFDIIIDDGSHMGEITKTSFWHLFDNHLKSGGLYAIEDWGTGYWDDWPDGKSLDFRAYDRRRSLWQKFRAALKAKMPMPGHSYGMVGFVKQLVDEMAAHDVTRQTRSATPLRGSKFKSVTFVPSVVFIRKA